MYDGDKFEVNGLKFVFSTERDDSMGEPWKEHDGHGIVSEWTTRDKKPGERVLVKDGSSRRYYDIQETMRIALKDGWGVSDVDTKGMTRRQIAALAVDRDYEHLAAWCNDEWYWCGVIVTLLDKSGHRTDESASLWGIESEDDDYMEEVAKELAEEIAERIGDAKELVRTTVYELR